MSAGRLLSGHLRTVGRLLSHTLRPPPPPPARPFRTAVEDPEQGAVPVSGWLTPAAAGADQKGAPAPPGRTLAVLLHGLGGSADSHYLAAAAAAASAAGLAALRLNSRGADPGAGDIYHAGLTSDLHAAVAAPALARYERIVVLGFSLGGHLGLRYAAEVRDPRVRAVAAVCAPLDLSAAALAFERPACAPYRIYVLRRLRRLYRELERRGARLPSPYAVVRRARTLRQWDAVTVVPRFGFRDTADYYARASAARVLKRLRVPCLLAAAEHDPMIPPRTIRPWAPQAPGVVPPARLPPTPAADDDAEPAAGHLTVVFHQAAGHVAFPRHCDLGLAGARGLEPQLLTWLARQP